MKKNRWVRGDPGWNPPAEKQEYCKWVKCKVGCIQNESSSSTNSNTPGGCLRPAGESRLPAAIVPPPGLGKIIRMRKICKKFDARSMQVYFFAKYCLKRLISPTTNQNEHPRVQNNQNLALHGTKRDPI